MEFLDFRFRNKFYILIICLYISFFFAYHSSHLNVFMDAIERSGQHPLTLFQLAVFNLISVLSQFIIAFIITFIIAYYFQTLSLGMALAIPFLFRGISLVIAICCVFGVTDFINTSRQIYLKRYCAGLMVLFILVINFISHRVRWICWL